MKYKPSAVELMDDRILAQTEDNISQRNNRFFIQGKPGAIVIVEFVRETAVELDNVITQMVEELSNSSYGYAYPVVKGKDIPKVWELRKAGLGVLSNISTNIQIYEHKKQLQSTSCRPIWKNLKR